MNPKHILLVGVKGALLAFHRHTGEHLWATELKSSSSDFVTVIADDTCAYAHTGGELFCVELLTGRKLWQDKLKGFGYGLASLGLPDGPAASPSAEALRQIAAATAAAHNTQATSVAN